MDRDRRRELHTVETMIDMFCRHHHAPEGPRCEACEELARYAAVKLQRCTYGDAKPSCNRCPVHCYKPRMRERVREVMRFAGPRMALRHPYLATMHLLARRKPVPGD